MLAVSAVGWTLMVALYIALLLAIGITCIRKGHWVMFLVGILFPLLWIVGAVMPPTEDARAS